MKVLFAVNNENISTQIVKKYQKEYKEIISYKNMYYFNAIIKELQRDKSYDRIVISEDLEPFANNNYEEIEKFLFEKLDNISDEATGINGKDIPIILLASDKRTKSEPILVKLFGIGIYDVLLGQDRTTNNVCQLLNKPRNKKEAKTYYKIETEEVNYKSESEDNVSEIEIKNILNHYRKLGKDEDRYITSFNNIAAQYNDAQLRIITKFLPLNVKAVLEEQSPKYQSVMTFGESSTAELMKKKKEEEGLKVGFLNYTSATKPTKNVIVPSNVKKVAIKKSSSTTNTVEPTGEIEELNKEVLPDFEEVTDTPEVDVLSQFDDIEELTQNEPKVAQPVKRGRGRPKKNVTESDEPKVNVLKRGRGRPKKVVEPVENIDEDVLPGFDDVEETTLPRFDNAEETTLPGFDDIEESETLPGFDDIEESETLPGFDGIEESEALPGFDDIEESETLPGFDDIEESETLPGFDDIEKSETLPGFDDIEESETLPGFDAPSTVQNNSFESSNVSGLLSGNKKVVSFVGTTKNGTSFVVNNLAKTLSSMGIRTAILDLTTNRNSYYIYTKNEEKLRNMAYESIRKLTNGIANGIIVNKYLDVYTALPGDRLPLENAESIISTLLQNYSVVLMDCDFNTPVQYFEIAKEMYIVQTMDILTIQPMTAFLRDLKAKEILQPEKIKVIINKQMNISGLTPKLIIGGLSSYNDPAMSFMTELFNRDQVKYCTIPFNEDVCSKYLEGIMDCEIKTNSYPKSFNNKLKELANIVYPLLENNKKGKENYKAYNNFSEDMNNTLEQMKNKY